MAARRKKKAARRKKSARQPALARSLEKSAKKIDQSLQQDRVARRRAPMMGFGWISVVLTAIREFCKNWPKLKAALKRVIAFLKKNGQDELAKILEGLVKFLDSFAKICKIVP